MLILIHLSTKINFVNTRNIGQEHHTTTHIMLYIWSAKNYATNNDSEACLMGAPTSGINSFTTATWLHHNWRQMPQTCNSITFVCNKETESAPYTMNPLDANFLSLPNQSYTYENLYWSFMLFLIILLRPLRPFLVLLVGVSLREVLSVVEVLPTLDVSSCRKQTYFSITCTKITFWTWQPLCWLPH
jgi:hypothetical protein